MKRIQALVTPSVMKWAREKAGYDIQTAAKKIGRPESDIESWEDGSARPTLAQTRKAAAVYKRSLAVFYLPGPPKDFDTLRDFRYLPTGQPREYSPELALLIRQVQVRQEWLREFLTYEGAGELPFVGSADIGTPPHEIARSIRDHLHVSLKEQMSCSTRREALILWIDKAEDAGVSVCRQGRIECEEARGLVLTGSRAPFVYLNSNDALVAQLFTLVHELAHAWINAPGLSNLEGLDRRPRTQNAAIEVFCNRVAAAALVDDDQLDQEIAKASPDLSLEGTVEKVAGSFKVSEEVIARKLLDRKRITPQQYRALRAFYARRWKQYARRKRDRSAGGNYYYMKLASNGRAFTQTVISAFHSGIVTIRDASGILGVKANHLADLAVVAGVPMRPAG